ncbi:MAG: hypothetical protein QXL91_06600 [Candidatus Bathyarchaeia archaeon]
MRELVLAVIFAVLWLTIMNVLKGFKMKFGLFAVDIERKTNNAKRVKAYKKVLEAGF